MKRRLRMNWMCEEIGSLNIHPMPALPTAVQWSHQVLAPRLRDGDLVVDATAGNGHDTLFLAQHVLSRGRVFAFDVQSTAIEATRVRIANEAGVTLINAGHEDFSKHLPADSAGKIRAFMFNLGFLPGGDKALITRTETTLHALSQACDWLEHDAAKEESRRGRARSWPRWHGNWTSDGAARHAQGLTNDVQP